MVNSEAARIIDKLISTLTKAQRAKVKDLIDGYERNKIPAIPVPDTSKKLLNFRLRLTWENGHVITTDDYGIAAAYVNVSTNTLVNYLWRSNEVKTFKDPQVSSTIVVRKVILLKEPL